MEESLMTRELPLVFRGVESYLPQFTSSHGQNVVDSRGAAEYGLLFTTGNQPIRKRNSQQLW
jgi:hypothetical protein